MRGAAGGGVMEIVIVVCAARASPQTAAAIAAQKSIGKQLLRIMTWASPWIGLLILLQQGRFCGSKNDRRRGDGLSVKTVGSERNAANSVRDGDNGMLMVCS